MNTVRQNLSAQRVSWVPEAVWHYLDHTVRGQSIRALARKSECHPSTILRQVRRFESRRDDPLVDGALRALAPDDRAPDVLFEKGQTTMMTQKTAMICRTGALDLDEAEMERLSLPALRALCAPGAVLAAARDMETAVVVKDGPLGATERAAMVSREVAQAMALRTWIECPEPDARILRYFITNAGRAAVRRLTAQQENRANGFREARAGMGWDEAEEAARARYHVPESPLIGLARRRDKTGAPYLSKELVDVGQRLRQDFQIAEPEAGVAEDWRGALTDAPKFPLAKATMDARARVRAALEDLGPGLADVVLECCCLLEGLEVTEKKMGWSARSGKIVLRIALQRLRLHYEETGGRFAPLIG